MSVLLRRPAALAADDPRRFKLHSGQVRAIEIKDEATGKTKKFIEGTASSTVEDRYGDTITEPAQLQMLDQSKGLTMWLNHSYKIPEDVLGTCVTSELQRGTDATQGPCLDLIIRCEIDEENPRAVKSWQHIQNGTKLAFSIGGYFLDVEFKDEDDWWAGFIINGIELLEISLVGIPANPRAYTKDAAANFIEEMTKALRGHAKAHVDGLEEGVDRKAERMAFTKSLFGPGEEPDTLDDDIATSETTAPITAGKLSITFEGATVESTAEFENLVQKLGAIVGVTITKEDGDATDQPDLDPELELRCLSAMRCIKKATAHGLCVDGYAHAAEAHAHVKSILPDDYEAPEDAQLPDDMPAVDRAAHVDAGDVEPAAAQKAALEGEITKLTADIETKKSELTKLGTEVQNLETKIAELKATPAGRRSALPGGSSSASEPIIAIESYYRTPHELAASIGRGLTGETSDARARAATS